LDQISQRPVSGAGERNCCWLAPLTSEKPRNREEETVSSPTNSDEDPELQKMWAEDREDEDHPRQSVATTVTFGEEWDNPVADLEAAKKHGWQVARPDAYPEVFHKERGLSLRPPLAWELELMEGCLRAVPDFVTRHQQDDPAKAKIAVPVASGPLKLVLSWVMDNG
jgi:hypothetical protein